MLFLDARIAPLSKIETDGKEKAPSEEVMQMWDEMNLEYFADIPDFEIFSIYAVHFSNVELLGMDFKSFYDSEQLYAGALEVGMKACLSKFHFKRVKCLSIHESELFFRQIIKQDIDELKEFFDYE